MININNKYDFAVNVVVVIGIAIHKIFFVHDFGNTLLITKISSAKILLFSML